MPEAVVHSVESDSVASCPSFGAASDWRGHVPDQRISSEADGQAPTPCVERPRRLVVDDETDEWTLLELSVKRRIADGELPAYPSATEYKSWTDEQLRALRLDPEDHLLEIAELDPFDPDLGLGPDDLADIPGARDVPVEAHPLNHAVELVEAAQQELRIAESARVRAALGAWRVAVASVTGTPDAMVNGVFHKSVMMQLAHTLQIAEQTASALVHTADLLETALPKTWARFVAGEVPWRGMQMVHAAIDGLDEEYRAAFDEKAAAAVVGTPMPKLKERLHRLRERLQARTAPERHRAAFAGRHVELEPLPNGMVALTNVMPAPEGVFIDRALDQAAVAAAAVPGETRTIAQLRSDILTDLWAQGLQQPAQDAEGVTVPTRRGIHCKVAVLIPAMTALGVSESPATLEGYGPIDLHTAKRLAGGATSWIKVLTDPVTGAVVTVGRDKYRPTDDMRALLSLLDQGGRGPNCRRSPGQTEADHIVPFNQGFARGETALDNLVLLSRRDHRIKTSGLWDIELLEGRDLAWTSFMGTRIITTVEPLEPTPVPPEYLGAAPSEDADRPGPSEEDAWADEATDELDCPF